MEYTTVAISEGREWKFKKDLTMGELEELGENPTELSSQTERMDFNKNKICAFSHDPVLTIEKINKLNSFDYAAILKEVVIDYNTRMLNFHQAPEKEAK